VEKSEVAVLIAVNMELGDLGFLDQPGSGKHEQLGSNPPTPLIEV